MQVPKGNSSGFQRVIVVCCVQVRWSGFAGRAAFLPCACGLGSACGEVERFVLVPVDTAWPVVGWSSSAVRAEFHLWAYGHGSVFLCGTGGRSV